MHELICPNCKKPFTVNEDDYAAILNQVKGAEFNAEVDRRIAELHKQQEAEQKAREAQVGQEHQKELSVKDKVIGEKDSEILRLKEQLSAMSDKRELESAYNMAIKGLVTGDYNDDNVNIEREKLLSEYSTQKHIYHNLFEHISSRLYPQGLKYPDHLSNKISLERNSLMPLFWRLLRGKKYSEYFDKLDKTCSWKGFTDSTLSEINEDLSNYSALTKVFRDIECWEKDPQYSII